MNNTSSVDSKIGIALAIIGASLWGISGVFVQFLFLQKSVAPEWLVTIRLLAAGVLLLISSLLKEKKLSIAIWKNKHDAIRLLMFGVLGMLGVQFTYFVAIKHANAATATVLQYLGPAFIFLYYALVTKKAPRSMELFSLALGTFGTIIMVTHGNFLVLSISPAALFWGIASAITAAFYTIQPINLLRNYGARDVLGWGMVIGGIVLNFFYPAWIVPGNWDLSTFIAVIFIIIFGTLIPFFLFLKAVTIIGAKKAGVLGCAEPISAAVVSIFWLNSPMGPIPLFGACLILLAIYSLTKRVQVR